MPEFVRWIAAPGTRWRTLIALWLVALLLGLAIGATVTVAMVADALLFNPLPIPEAERVVLLGGLAYSESLGDPIKWWSRAEGLASLAVYSSGDALLDGENEWIHATAVTPEFFSVFQVEPTLGRDFSEDDIGMERRVAILSDAFWRSRFGGDLGVLGTEFRIDKHPFVVVGVAPPLFAFPSGTDVWVAEGRRAVIDLVSGPTGFSSGRTAYKAFVGRLQPATTPEQVRDQLAALLDDANTNVSPQSGVRYGEIVGVIRLPEALARHYGPTLTALFLGAGFVLLLASSNCALFLVGRSTSRWQETAIKATLGASTGRLVKETIGEALRLGVVCGLLGMMFATLFLAIVKSLMASIPVYIRDSEPMFTLFGVSLATGVVTGLVAGTVPALQAGSKNLTAWLSHRGGPVSGRRGALVRRSFIVVEVAAAFVLVTGALLCARTLLNLTLVELGYEPEGTYALQFVSRGPHSNSQELKTRQDRVLEIASGFGNIAAAALADGLPVFSQDRQYVSVGAEGKSYMAAARRVRGQYFAALGLPIVEGRSFSSADGTQVVAVSESVAHLLWGRRSALGKELRTGRDSEPLDVIAVVADTIPVDEIETSRLSKLAYYRSFPDSTAAISGNVEMVLLFRCHSNCEDLAAALPRRIEQVDRVVALQVAPLERTIESAQAPARLRAGVWGAYGVVAVVIALVGVYVVISYLVSLRRFEIGLRLALGAHPKQLSVKLLRDVILSVMLGLAVGAGLSMSLMRVLGSLLLGVTPADVLSFVLAGSVLLLGSVGAALFPTVRAAYERPLKLLEFD